MKWTPEQDARLRALAATGLYAQQVVDKLIVEFKEFSITRNSVIGRAARMKPKVEWGHEPVGGVFTHTERSRRAVEARRNRKPGRPRKIKIKSSAGDLPPPVAAIVANEPVTVGLPLMRLREHHCRYPQGEHEYLFCSAPRFNGFSYCAFHQLLTHRRR